MTDLTLIFGILALIFLVAALASGLVERAPISFPMIFLGLGFLIGEHGLGWIKVGLDDPVLKTVATLSLAFVLFLDAINLNFVEIRDRWIVPVLSLGPGTLLTMALIAIFASLILKFSLIQALLIGAVLSSVDPVLLRDVVRDERIPRAVRESLRTEAGANDMIVLPIVLLLASRRSEPGRNDRGLDGVSGPYLFVGTFGRVRGWGRFRAPDALGAEAYAHQPRVPGPVRHWRAAGLLFCRGHDRRQRLPGRFRGGHCHRHAG